MRAQINAEEMPSAVNGGERQDNLGMLKNNCTEKMNNLDCVTEPPCPKLGTPDASTENDTFSPYAIHELIVATAEAIVQKHNSRQTTNDCNASVKSSLSQSLEGTAVHEKGVLLQRKLDQLHPEQRSCLALKDDNGCTTAHLAARFGLLEFCEIILSRMLAWGLLADNIYFSCLWEKDSSENIPLHYSVKSGQFEMTRLLIDSMKLTSCASGLPVAKLISLSSVLNLAALGDHPDVLRVLLSSNEFDINYRDSESRTALHTAVALGHVEVAKILLSSRPSVEIEAVDVNSLTPLALACISGHLEMVELLVNAGADVKKLDASNWSARDHALYNGHIAVSNRLGELLSANPPFPHHPGRSEYYRQNDMLTSAWNQKSCTNSTNETKLFINLGSLNPRKPAKSFEYDALSPIKSELEEKHDMLSMSISVINETGQSQTMTVSLTEDSPSDPVIFSASNLTQAKLIFDLTVEDHPEASKRPIARGVTLVSASSLISLRGRTYIGQSSTLPLMSPPTMDVIGYVNFTSLLVTPFHHPNLLDCGNWTDWENTDGPLIIGHRGLGKNVSNQYHLQLGENTLQSFTAAAKLGAPYIEFDVQLTKDHVPVIYHDYIVSETGVDIPMHTITLKQLRFANSQQSHNFATKDRTSEEPSINAFLRSRSFSMSASGHEQSKILERIKQTNDYKKKGFKSNTRGLHIQETFATLQEMFSKMPTDLGFNIELKYPMLHDTEKEDLDLSMVEMNLYVDSILQVVFDMGKERNVIFSSFNADVCIMLVMKQPQIPVLFLTNAGTQPVLDIRSRSLRNAVRFASQWGLAGIVSIADPLIASPGLVTHIKDSGFLCLSYGTVNTEIENIKIQAEKGVNGVIVDCLPLVLHEVAQMRQNLKA